MFTRKLLLIMLLLAACTPATLPAAVPQPTDIRPVTANIQPPSTQTGDTTAQSTDELTPGTVPDPLPTNVRIDDDQVYSFPQLLPYDGIRPVYTPEFVSPEAAPLQDEELVMGVFISGAAKAYPVSVLRFREMVDDELGGIPILVTW